MAGGNTFKPYIVSGRRPMNYSAVGGVPGAVMFGPLGLAAGLFTKRQKYTLTFVLKEQPV